MNLRKIGNVYHATFAGADGKSKSVTTRCSDKDEARRVIRTAGFTGLETAAKVARFHNSVVSQIVAGRKVTMAHALDAYAKDAQARARSPKTIHNSLLTLRAWVAAMNLDGTAPAAITREHVAGWINDVNSTNTAGTRQVNLAILRAFFTFLLSKRWVPVNPATTVPVDYHTLSHEQKEAAVRIPFTADDITRLLGFVKADWDEAAFALAKIMPDKGPLAYHAQRHLERVEQMRFWDFAVRLSHETGLRLGDVCGLEWKCFEKPGSLTVWTGKTDKRIEMTVGDALLDLVAGIPVEHAQFVFPKEREINRDPKRRSLLSVQFARLCKLAKVSGKSFHSLRRTKANDEYAKMDKAALAKELAAALTLGQIQQMLGHTSSKMTKGYLNE